MKFKYCILLGALLFASCDKGIQVDAPSFDITTKSNTYKVGEEIKFNISGGNSHMISFYSGETLKNYFSREGRVIDVSTAGVSLQFQNSVQVGTQANQLSFLYSTDFNGDYSSLASVKAATWTDITSRFGPLATSATFAPTLANATKDISDLVIPGKPIYFAFKYITKPQATNGLVRQWFIQLFQLKSNLLLDNSIPLIIADQVNAGFRIVDENKEKAPGRSVMTATRLTLYGNVYLTPDLPQFDPTQPRFNPLDPMYNPRSDDYVPSARYVPFVAFDPTSPYNDPLSEQWAITKPITIDKVDLGPDISTAIKGVNNPNISEFTYTYTKAGTYDVVFIASNNSIDNTKQVVKQIKLTIEP